MDLTPPHGAPDRHPHDHVGGSGGGTSGDGLDVLLLSFPRSGSSALRHELNRFEDVLIPRESAFAVWVARRLESTEPHRRIERFVDEVMAARKFEFWGLEAEDVAACAPLAESDPARAVRAVYHVLRARVRPRARIIGDKNNSYVFDVDAAIRILRPGHLVLLWRDPHEIRASFERLRTVRAGVRGPGIRYFPPDWPDADELFRSWAGVHRDILERAERPGAPPLISLTNAQLRADPAAVAGGLVRTVTGRPGRRTSPPPELLEPPEFAPWKQGLTERSASRDERPPAPLPARSSSGVSMRVLHEVGEVRRRLLDAAGSGGRS